MSGFACILDRTGGPVDPARIERLGGGLADFGDVTSTLCSGPFGVVVRHRADPDALNRYGPLQDDTSQMIVAVAGRFGRVGDRAPADVDEPGPGTIGCARWLLERWACDGPVVLDRIAGAFSLVVADVEAGRVTVVRDHLGSLKVLYLLTDRLLVASGQAAAILRAGAVVPEPDDGSVARFLGFRFGHTEHSFFRGIRELAPAHRLEVEGPRSRAVGYWRFDAERRDPPFDEVQKLFIDQLERSMQHHIAGLPPDRLGLSLGGGLDSTAVAAMAPSGTRAYSWRFERLPDPAETANIDAVSNRLGLPVRWVRGDDELPLASGFAARFVHPDSPYINPFAALKARLYEVARIDGCRRMMVGDGGDVLYQSAPYWLRDLVSARRPGSVASVVGAVRRALHGDPLSRSALARLAPGPCRGAGRALVGRRRSPWMTRRGRSLLPTEALSPIVPDGCDAERWSLSIGARNIELESEEQALFARCGVERANPFWFRPLLEALLQLPADRLHRDGRDKVLAREAMRDRLPASVLDSCRVGLLGSFFLLGIERRREHILDSVFRKPSSDWQRFVRRDWLEPYLFATDSIDFGHTILWRVISYELWIRRNWGS